MRHLLLNRFATTLFASVLATSAVACVEVSDPCGGFESQTSALQLGTGNVQYLELQDGGEIGMHFGPQGGYHVYGSLRAEAVYPGPQQEIQRYFGNTGTETGGLERLNPTASYTLSAKAGDLEFAELEPGDVLAERQLQAPLLPQDDDSMTREGDIVFFPVGTNPFRDASGNERLNGNGEPIQLLVDFEVTVTDLCGNELRDEYQNLELFIETAGNL